MKDQEEALVHAIKKSVITTHAEEVAPLIIKELENQGWWIVPEYYNWGEDT